MKIEIFFGILFLLMIMQVIGTRLQVREYHKAIHRLHATGNVGVGARKHRFGAGNVVMIACDSNGVITGGEMMEGITIFTRFKEIPDIMGRNIYELKEDYEGLEKKRRKSDPPD